MFEFSLADKNDVLYINKKTNNQYPVNAIFMVGKDKDKFVGYCAFILKEGQAVLLDAAIENTYDSYVLEIICKAAFNSIDLSGIKDIYCENINISNLLQGLKFKKVSEKQFHLNLEGYFKPCNCKH